MHGVTDDLILGLNRKSLKEIPVDELMSRRDFIINNPEVLERLPNAHFRQFTKGSESMSRLLPQDVVEKNAYRIPADELYRFPQLEKASSRALSSFRSQKQVDNYVRLYGLTDNQARSFGTKRVKEISVSDLREVNVLDVPETLNRFSDEQFTWLINEAHVSDIAELPISVIQSNITRITPEIMPKFRSQLEKVDPKYLLMMDNRQASALPKALKLRRSRAMP